MAEKQQEETANNAGGDQPDAVQETLLEAQQDPEAQEEAEIAVRGYLRDRLESFIGEIESACDSIEAQLAGQSQEVQVVYNQNGFFDFLGDRFQEQLAGLTGGSAPLMSALVGEVNNVADFSSRNANNLSQFINNAFRRGTRDAAWFVRDATPTLLGDKWNDVLALAADGANQFVPALHSLGIPPFDFNPTEFANHLVANADAYRLAMGDQKKDIEQEQDTSSEKQAEMAQSSQQEMMEEDTTKAATV